VGRFSETFSAGYDGTIGGRQLKEKGGNKTEGDLTIKNLTLDTGLLCHKSKQSILVFSKERRKVMRR